MQGLAEARVLFETALGRPLDQDAEAAIAARIAAGHFDGFALLIEVIGSS